MQKRIAVVKNQVGIRSRPAAVFFQEAQKFESSIHLKYQNRLVNGKSLLGILSCSILGGETVEITADGPDEQKALEWLTTLVESGFVNY